MPFVDIRLAGTATLQPRAPERKARVLDARTSFIVGDILSDQASMCVGSIGLLASAALAEGTKGLYEPIHGSVRRLRGRWYRRCE